MKGPCKYEREVSNCIHQVLHRKLLQVWWEVGAGFWTKQCIWYEDEDLQVSWFKDSSAEQCGRGYMAGGLSRSLHHL